jgi:hypothetical protein
MNVRKLQRKYGLAVRFGASFFKAVLFSPHIKPNDLKAMKASFAANRELIEWVMTKFSRMTAPQDNGVPVFYLLGDRDTKRRSSSRQLISKRSKRRISVSTRSRTPSFPPAG